MKNDANNVRTENSTLDSRIDELVLVLLTACAAYTIHKVALQSLSGFVPAGLSALAVSFLISARPKNLSAKSFIAVVLLILVLMFFASMSGIN